MWSGSEISLYLQMDDQGYFLEDQNGNRFNFDKLLNSIDTSYSGSMLIGEQITVTIKKTIFTSNSGHYIN